MIDIGQRPDFPIAGAPGGLKQLEFPASCDSGSCQERMILAMQRADRLNLQTQVGLNLLRNEDPDRVLEDALKQVAEAFDSSWCGLWLVSPGGEMFRLGYSWHSNEPHIKPFQMASRQIITRNQANPGLFTRVLDSPDPVWVADYATESTDRVWAAKRAELKSWIGVPLAGVKGPHGVMEMFPRGSQAPDAERMASLSVIALKLARYVERNQVYRALKDSERRYRLMFEDNPCPMWVIGWPRLNFLAVNHEALRLYDYGETEFLTMSYRDICPPGALAELHGHYHQVPEHDAAGVCRQRTQHMTSDGRILDVDLTHYGIEWQGRRAELVMITDVTERLAIERQRDAMELQLRHAQKLEAIGNLAAGIAHEINTPSQYISDNLRFLRKGFEKIASVLDATEALIAGGEALPPGAADGLVELAKSVRTSMEDARLDYLKGEVPWAIQQSIDGLTHVSTIVAAMKEFSHPSRKEKALCDLNRAIRSTVVISRNEWKYCADLETDLDPQLPQVPCMMGEVNQVILNLIVNAAHAIQDKVPEGDKGEIKVRTRLDGDFVEIQVEDTGGGIPEEIQERIFDPFFTTKDVGRGTGQGLAIARSIVVDKHGGTIHFKTKPGHGTTFFVRFPLTAS